MQISQAVREKMLLALGLGLIATTPSADCAPAENGRPARPTQSTPALDEGKPSGPVSAPHGIAAAKDAGGAPGCYAPGPKDLADDGIKPVPRRHSRLHPVNYPVKGSATASGTASGIETGTASGTASGTATPGTAVSGKPGQVKVPGTCSSEVPPVVIRKGKKTFDSCPACGRG